MTPQEKIVDEVLEGVLSDWKRLKTIENNVTAAMAGRDLLGEIERLRDERDRWAKQAIALQLDAVAAEHDVNESGGGE